MNYSWYFKNMPGQEKLMKEAGAEYFAVSVVRWCNVVTIVTVVSSEETF